MLNSNLDPKTKNAVPSACHLPCPIPPLPPPPLSSHCYLVIMRRIIVSSTRAVSCDRAPPAIFRLRPASQSPYRNRTSPFVCSGTESVLPTWTWVMGQATSLASV